MLKIHGNRPSLVWLTTLVHLYFSLLSHFLFPAFHALSPFYLFLFDNVAKSGTANSCCNNGSVEEMANIVTYLRQFIIGTSIIRRHLGCIHLLHLGAIPDFAALSFISLSLFLSFSFFPRHFLSVSFSFVASSIWRHFVIDGVFGSSVSVQSGLFPLNLKGSWVFDTVARWRGGAGFSMEMTTYRRMGRVIHFHPKGELGKRRLEALKFRFLRVPVLKHDNRRERFNCRIWV